MNRWFAISPCVVALFISEHAQSQELPPGLLDDPEGLEMFADATYNAVLDEYLVTCAGGTALGLRVSPCGELLGQVVLSSDPRPANNVSQVAVEYNPDRNEYLVVIRYDEPQDIFARYLDSQGEPLGTPFPIRVAPDKGGSPGVHYSTKSKRYLVRWDWGYRQVLYRMVDGDSTAAQPLIGDSVVIAGDGTQGSALVAQAAYGDVSDRFLFAYVTATSGNNGDVFGRFVSGDGVTLLTPPFAITGGAEGETNPQLAYASSTDKWIVTWEDVNTPPGNGFDVNGAMVDADGQVTQPFTLAATPNDGWDVPGPIAYNAHTDKFLATWFFGVSTYAREVDPADSSLAESFVVSNRNASPTAIAVRPNPAQPQFLVTWREQYNGVFGSLVPIQADCSAQDAGANDGGDSGQDDGGWVPWDAASADAPASDGGSAITDPPSESSGCGCRTPSGSNPMASSLSWIGLWLAHRRP